MAVTPRFQVYLNGTLLEDEPGGLMDAKLTIDRDDNLKGIFLQYTSELWFYGDGFDILRQAVQDGGDCTEVTCSIYYSCGNQEPYELLFEGVIPLGESYVDWDLYNCIVTTKVENADFSNLLIRYQDYRVRLNSTGVNKTIDGTTALTNMPAYLTDFFSDLGTGTYDIIGRSSVKFIDALQYVLSFLSNNQITLDEDSIYNTLYEPQQLEINLPATGGVQELIRVTFTNYYDQEYVVEQNINTASAGDIQDLALAIMHVSGTVASDRNNFFEKASWTNLTAITPPILNVRNYLPWKSYTVQNITSGVFGTINETQAFVYGLKNLSFTTSTHLAGQGNYIYVSLNDLMRHATQFHNVGFRLVSTGGGNYDFQLRTQENLLNASQSILLENVPNIKRTSGEDFNLTTITTPRGNADNHFTPLSLNTGVCFGDKLTIEGDRFSSQEFVEAFDFSGRQDDKIFWFFMQDGDGPVPATSQAEQFEYYMVSSSGAAFVNYFLYNAPYINGLVAARYLVNSGGKNLKTSIAQNPADGTVGSVCAICPQAEIENTTGIALPYLYTFESPITFTQVKELIQNSLNYVQFTDQDNLARQGYLQTAEIPFRDFVASFALHGD